LKKVDDQFEEWKRFVEDAISDTAPEATSEELAVPKGLSTVVEEDED